MPAGAWPLNTPGKESEFCSVGDEKPKQVIKKFWGWSRLRNVTYFMYVLESSFLQLCGG